MIVIGVALIFAEVQTRQTATIRWFLLAVLWTVLTALLLAVASG